MTAKASLFINSMKRRRSLLCGSVKHRQRGFQIAWSELELTAYERSARSELFFLY